MALESFNQVPNSDTATFTTESRTYTQLWQGISNDRFDTAETIQRDELVPRRYTTMPGDPTAILQEVQPERDPKSLFAWNVRLTYRSPRWGRTLEQDKQPDPLLRSPDIRWTFNTIQRVAYTDRTSPTPAPVTNSAGDPPDPPLLYTEYLPVVSITRNEREFSIQRASDYMGSVNSGTFWGAPTHCALISDFSASRATEHGINYWQVHYQIEFNLLLDYTLNPPGRHGWDMAIDDVGFYEITGTPPARTRIKDSTGKDRVLPWFLDGAGHAQPDNGTQPTPKRLYFLIRKEMDFTPLQIDYGMFPGHGDGT